MVALAPQPIKHRDLGQVRIRRGTPETIGLFGPFITSFSPCLTTLPTGVPEPGRPLAGPSPRLYHDRLVYRDLLHDGLKLTLARHTMSCEIQARITPLIPFLIVREQ